MVPSKIDMSNYKNLAIATVSSYPFRPFELPNPVVRDLSGTSPVRVYSGFTVNTERAMSEALTKTIVREAYDSDYFTILTPSVTDAFVNRPYMLYEQGYEALLTVYTSDVEVEEFIYAKEKEVVIPNENPALVQIAQAINDNWKRVYKGRHLNEAALNFPVGDIDEILKLIQLQFMPDASGNYEIPIPGKSIVM